MLSGAGLMVAGVASAVTVPEAAPGIVVDGPQDGAGGLLGGVGAATPGGAASPSDTPTGSGAGTDTTVTQVPTAGGKPSAPTDGLVPPQSPAGAAPGTPGGSTATANPTAAAQPTTGGGMTQPKARQTLAETGTDRSLPWLLVGGATLVAGGLVFRFGPRGAAR
ncbi:LPXTG cell wall anchor domain-containing protein [Streptacidiphilus sp. EB129]|uniref:LPXTG cell wall anchor domain-containing protein n=1 Tax=Streptacidiphilus sp. EB129 TaxID=3156262 RepID=UPI0035142216